MTQMCFTKTFHFHFVYSQLYNKRAERNNQAWEKVCKLTLPFQTAVVFHLYWSQTLVT